ncbi:little elongation complex subunit 2 [Astyanax mexicanus]|uniref:little elongation complex subunit 2 n=1 Tax=Astyanax mexicanus TaxID=7994 RepID=UPI0020CB3E22|nr:little elongation complex subunit 2 [Astyanax mexicanus]
MELKWDDGPVSEPVLFSKDIFDKYSLAPTVQELWALLQSPDVKEENTSRPVGTSSPPKLTKSNTVAPKTSSRNSHGSVGSASDRSDTVTDSKNNLTDADCKEPKGFPEPEVPYPCYTALSIKQRIEYLNSIKNKKHLTTPQNIMQTVQMEIAEFMKYVQDVSKFRADKYKYVPLGATRYLEEYFKASMEYIKYYPQHYSIQEITSLTGGKFIPDISLNFEKQLLAMGSVDMLEKWIVPGKPQLSVDYDSVSAVIPPSTKARHFHKAISSDTNAEKLSAIYEPHVCLAKEAFIQLLNNSSEHSEPWELPVWVKEKSGKGSTLSKTVYIDPPLLKTQMTWRERNHLFHEESIKLAYKKTASNPVFFLETEDFASKVDFVPEAKSNSRAVVSFDETGIDFEVDVTELESFGESSQLSKNVKEEDKPEDHFKHETLPLSKPKSGSDKTSEVLTKVASTLKAISPPLSTPSKEKLQEETVSTDVEDSSVDKRSGDILSEDQMSNSSTVEESPSADCPPSKRIKHSSASSPDHTMDSDEERLVIDHFGSPLKNQAEKTKTIQATPENTTETTLSSLKKQTADSTVLPSTTSPAKGTKKGVKRSRVSEEGDQLGQILRMQNAMLKSKVGKGQETPKPHPECRPPEPRVSIHHQPLVKPCVSSYLDSKEGLVEEAVAPAVAQSPPRKKRLLKEELRVSAEDEQDYEAPTESSVFYKLYSLMDVLLMVRSTVDIAHPRHDQDTFRAVPVHVLPKLEYQLCYGAELLTHTEVCRLWAEQLLHTSTASFIGRINAHTSKVAELQELPADWIQNTSCNFKPARCLNTLHHILKKVTSLPEGRYLLVHKPGEAFVSIFKANDGNKTSRSIYDLQAVHCGPPVPLEAKVPWVPLDPFHILPFHQKYKRPPCTFPPCPYQGKKLAGGNKGAKHANTPNNPPRGTQQFAAVPGQNHKKKKNKKKNKPNKWTEKMKNKQKKEIQIKKKSSEQG